MTAIPDFAGALNALELPQLVEGDTFELPTASTILSRPSDYCAMYYPGGQPMRGEDAEIVWSRIRKDITNTDLFMKTALKYLDVITVVHTSYLGVNMQVFNGPPLFWESMVSLEGNWSDFQWRYGSRNAAKAGHDQIVNALVSTGMARADAELERMYERYAIETRES